MRVTQLGRRPRGGRRPLAKMSNFVNRSYQKVMPIKKATACTKLDAAVAADAAEYLKGCSANAA